MYHEMVLLKMSRYHRGQRKLMRHRTGRDDTRRDDAGPVQLAQRVAVRGRLPAALLRRHVLLEVAVCLR